MNVLTFHVLPWKKYMLHYDSRQHHWYSLWVYFYLRLRSCIKRISHFRNCIWPLLPCFFHSYLPHDHHCRLPPLLFISKFKFSQIIQVIRALNTFTWWNMHVVLHSTCVFRNTFIIWLYRFRAGQEYGLFYNECTLCQ
jgi:hypothetical protein